MSLARVLQNCKVRFDLTSTVEGGLTAFSPCKLCIRGQNNGLLSLDEQET